MIQAPDALLDGRHVQIRDGKLSLIQHAQHLNSNRADPYYRYIIL